jgi:hypothetical protein
MQNVTKNSFFILRKIKKMHWWIYVLIFTLSLIILSIFANSRRYKYLRIAYSLYRDREENFLDYVLMETIDLENTIINEVNIIKKRETFWSKVSLLSYGLTTSICAAIMILSFYNLLGIPNFVSFIFLTLLICSAYINYRGWRYFKFSKKKRKLRLLRGRR